MLKIVAALMLLLPGQLLGQPDWFTKPESKYPHDRFLYGVGMGTGGDKAERMQIAEENARANLIKAIRTQISSEFIDETTESAQRIDASTQSRIVSTAALEVDGIRIEQRTEKKNAAYALALLEKREGRRLHRTKLERLDLDLERGLEAARKREEKGEREEALKAYLQLYPLLARREEAEAVLLAMGDFGQSAFDELDQVMGEEKAGRAEVDAAVERLTKGNFADLDEAAAALAFRLGAQLPSGRKVIVLPTTYGETKFTSEFSRYLARVLEHKLTDAGLRPVKAAGDFKPRTADHRTELARQAGAELVVSGSYLERGEGLKVFLMASDVGTGQKLGSVDVELAMRLVEADRLTVRPQNFDQALQDAGVFGTGELIGGGLQLELWTNRGSENVYLEKDEEVTLAVRVNQPCYVRLIYHLANGMRVLLYDGYYIDQSKVNYAVTLPDTFYVAEPFGVEVIQALASNEPFPPAVTRDWEGYPVLAEDLAEFVPQTRGLKKKQKEREVAEMRVTVTTLPRR